MNVSGFLVTDQDAIVWRTYDIIVNHYSTGRVKNINTAIVRIRYLGIRNIQFSCACYIYCVFAAPSTITSGIPDFGVIRVELACRPNVKPIPINGGTAPPICGVADRSEYDRLFRGSGRINLPIDNKQARLRYSLNNCARQKRQRLAGSYRNRAVHTSDILPQRQVC